MEREDFITMRNQKLATAKILKSSHGEIALTPEKLFSLDFKFVKEYVRYPEPKYIYDGRFDSKSRVLRFEAVSDCGAVVKLDLDKPKSIFDIEHCLLHQNYVFVLSEAPKEWVEDCLSDGDDPFYKGIVGGNFLTDEMIDIVKPSGFNEILMFDNEIFYQEPLCDPLTYKLLMAYATYLISELKGTEDLNSDYAKSIMDEFLCFMELDGQNISELYIDSKRGEYKITIPSPIIEFLCCRVFCIEGGL